LSPKPKRIRRRSSEESEPDGAVKCDCPRENCIAYKIPRSLLNEYSSNPKIKKELRESGIYFLYGSDHGEVYVGQTGVRKTGGGLLSRVKEHDNDKPDEAYWNEAIMLFPDTKNHPLTSTDLNYLENFFVERLQKIYSKSKCQNKQAPPSSGTSEDIYELHGFIKGIEIIIHLLGYKFLSPKPKRIRRRSSEESEPMKKLEKEITSLINLLDKDKIIETIHNKGYVVFKSHDKNRICMEKGQDFINLYLNLNPDDYKLEEGFTSDMRGIDHKGTGDLMVRITDEESLNNKTIKLITAALNDASEDV
ncbi:MAG TPA: hypothetical protein O0X32_03460, partial [Methanocorpusculum sp.]|nr:hypothetical protein [Methanocorpusculum sp.]